MHGLRRAGWVVGLVGAVVIGAASPSAGWSAPLAPGYATPLPVGDAANWGQHPPVVGNPSGLAGQSSPSRPPVDPYGARGAYGPTVWRLPGQNCGGLGSCAWPNQPLAYTSTCSPEAYVCTSASYGPDAWSLRCTTMGALRTCTTTGAATGSATPTVPHSSPSEISELDLAALGFGPPLSSAR